MTKSNSKIIYYLEKVENVGLVLIIAAPVLAPHMNTCMTTRVNTILKDKEV